MFHLAPSPDIAVETINFDVGLIPRARTGPYGWLNKNVNKYQGNISRAGQPP
jgi:hypothetical protein